MQLNAIFVSLELSRSTWLVTSLSPGRGERISRHQAEGCCSRAGQGQGLAPARHADRDLVSG
jgi:hypothetical protein